MKIRLDNAQHVPHMYLSENGKEILRIDFCKDGGIVRFTEGKNERSFGTRIGVRKKDEQAEYIDVGKQDGIVLGEV